jgi:protein transport protein SEC23
MQSRREETNLLIFFFFSIEYVLNRGASLAPAFVFVVDVCLSEDELKSLKSSLLMAISLLPDHAVIGLVTYGSTVQVFELAFDMCPKAYVFRGKTDYTSQRVSQLLGLHAGGSGAAAQYHGAPSGASAVAASSSAAGPSSSLPSSGPSRPGDRFLMSKSDCEFTLETILEELQSDTRSNAPSHRPVRATGAALSVAIGLLEATRAGSPARVMCFMGGPCTQGPGLVVNPPLSEPIRMHFDLQRNQAKHTKKASECYDALAQRAATNGHAVDLFSCSYDQVGIMEMRQLTQLTGGTFILTDEFAHDMFRDSFRKLFARDDKTGLMKMAFNAVLEVQPSRELKLLGCIGHAFPLKEATASVSTDRQIGMGGTSSWRCCSIDQHSNYSFFLELAAPSFEPAKGQKGLMQFKTTYVNSAGQHVLRVTTVAHAWASSLAAAQGASAAALDPWASSRMALSAGFDQEAAAVLMARIAVHRDDTSVGFQTLQWLDRALIKLCSNFGDYRPNDPESFRLSPTLSLYPQFMFHLRRCSLLQNFNSSPDESTYNRFMLLRENVSNSMMMIQPTLEAYTFDAAEPFPVLLSATSVAPDRILLLDTFFHVCIFSGSNIAEWRNLNYQNDPNYKTFKRLLEMPQQETALILAERFPRPRFVECDQGSSQARFLLAVVDPAVTHNSMDASSANVIFTDDVSLQTFILHLTKIASSTEKK